MKSLAHDRVGDGIAGEEIFIVPIELPATEDRMRALIFGAIFLVVAAAAFHTPISSSLAAARDARAATFSERFAPVLNQMK